MKRLVALALGALLGCDSFALREENVEPLPVDDGLPCDLDAVLSRSCWGIGCHGSNVPAAMLDLQSAGVTERVRDVHASHADILDGSLAQCDRNELLVDSANPDQSLILKKVSGAQSCGARMPLPPRAVTLEDTACLRAWVFRMAEQP